MARLVLSVFASVFIGGLLLVGLHFHATGGRSPVRFHVIFGLGLFCLLATLVWLRETWTPGNLPRRLAVSLVGLYSGILLTAWAQKLAGSPGPSVAQIIIGGLSFQGAAMAWVGCFLHDHRMSWDEGFGLKHRWPIAMAAGVGVACLFLPVGWGLQLGSFKLISWVGTRLPALSLKPESQEVVQTLGMAATFSSRLVLAVVTIVLAPASEELLFRGLLYPWIKRLGLPRLALWSSALLFATMHLNLVSFVPLTLLAVVLTLLYERTGNLLAPMTAHALFNAANFVLLYSFQEQMSRFR